jgi:polyphosphate kinase
VRFARIKVPPVLGRLIPLSDGERFVPIEQVLAAQLGRLFPGMEVDSHYFFRVTRDADMDLDDETDDLMRAIESGLHRRHRSSDAVRLEIDEGMGSEARNLLVEELDLREEDVYVRRGMLDLSDLGQLYHLARPDLKLEPWTPRTQLQLSAGDGEKVDLFAALRQGDVLVQHPYDSFESSVGAFLSQAADDPNVVAIKHTLYRSGTENPIARTVIRAANSGKQVVTLVELQARFDEQTNIEWARKLEEAGVHVVYGLLGFKTHGKIVLVVRQEEGQLRRYCHVGTGNYNVATARHYEDVGLFSASPELAADVADLFNHLTGFSQHPEYRKLLVAPETLRSGLLDQIRQEMEAPDGRIVVKCNGLVDARLIDVLYEASGAGVEIDLIVRGVCCLRPGVPGRSERIRVRSILGRFLEHSRIFRFGSDARGPRYFIGSADWMPRNLDRRVEVVAPIEDPAIQARVEQVLQLLLADDTEAWQLDATGTWRPPSRKCGLRAQEELQRLARDRSKRAAPVLD